MEAILLQGLVALGWANDLEKVFFNAPQWLWLFWLWPLLWLLSAVLSKKSATLSNQHALDDIAEQRSEQQLVAKHSLIHLMAKQTATAKAAIGLGHVWLHILRGLLILVLAVILAEPVEKSIPPIQTESKTVRDLVFVVESSATFLLPDYMLNGQPETRMNAVKQVLDQFIAGLPGNRFAVTIFADQAFTLLPITYDQTLARLMLKRLKPYLAGRNDMAMGEALGLALQQAEKGLNETQNQTETQLYDSSERKKVVILISDGLSRPSRLELTEAVNYANWLQVPIYTIGVGSSSEQADQREFSGLLYQPLESESLQQLASQTGGEYFQVGSGDEISRVLEQINQLEGTLYTPPPLPPQLIPLYRPLLSLAAALFLFYWLSRILLVRQSAAKSQKASKVVA